MDNLKTGQLIAEKRKELGMTQKALAEKLMISDRTISKWERGAGFPDVSLLLPLSEALGISTSELIQGEVLPDKTEEEKEMELALVQGITNIHSRAIRAEKKKGIKLAFFSVVGFVAAAVLALSAMVPYVDPISAWPYYLLNAKDKQMVDYVTVSALSDAEFAALVNYYILEGDIEMRSVLDAKATYVFTLKGNQGTLTIRMDGDRQTARYELEDPARGQRHWFDRSADYYRHFPDAFLLSPEEGIKPTRTYDLATMEKEHNYTVYKNIWNYLKAPKSVDETYYPEEDEWFSTAKTAMGEEEYLDRFREKYLTETPIFEDCWIRQYSVDGKEQSMKVDPCRMDLRVWLDDHTAAEVMLICHVGQTEDPMMVTPGWEMTMDGKKVYVQMNHYSDYDPNLYETDYFGMLIYMYTPGGCYQLSMNAPGDYESQVIEWMESVFGKLEQ